MQFGQLIEYNITHIFVEKSYIKCGRETIPSAFSRKSKINRLKFFSFFIVCQVEGYQSILNIETKLQTTCFYLI